MEESVIEVQIVVYGSVQGVSFRKWTKRLADEYSVTGWVKNTPHDTVIIYAQASRSRIDAFIRQIKNRGGPRIAEIEKIEIREVPFLGRYSSFKILKQSLNLELS